MTEAQYRKFLGVPQLFGERGYTFVEQRSARPTVEINGLTSGYQGEGSKTIVPVLGAGQADLPPGAATRTRRASAKLILTRLKKLCPPTVRMESPGRPRRRAVSGFAHQPAGPGGACATLKEAFGHEPILMREGGSIPIVTQFKKVLRADSLLLGLALPDDNAHSPNEKFSLDCYEKGARMGALLWPELARLG